MEPFQGVDVIAIDGKTLRGSAEVTTNTQPVDMVSAFATQARLTIGEQRSDSKGGEVVLY